MNHLQDTFERIWCAYSGEAAWQTVADLSRYHRIQASPGYRQAATLLHQRLVRDGLDVELLSFPANEQAEFWAWPSFQEWDCADATLHLVAPGESTEVLADFRACPISLIQRSISFEGEAEVILLQDGEEEADYDRLDVSGKVVLSQGDLGRVWELAVTQRGAIGLLFDGMRTVNPVRPEGDLADVRQYTSFWWHPGDVKGFGFVLTPRQGRELRRRLERGDAPLRVRARVASRLYDGTLEVVSATIPGQVEEEILVVAHLCHPQPSANDNASGAAAAFEAARTLQELIAKGDLARPKRTIRFLWLPEITGTFAYLSSRETELDRMVAGINLDMVGEDQEQTGSSWLIERPPDALTSFAPDLLVCLRDQLSALKDAPDMAPSHTGIGGYPLYRQADVAFSGGSDHFVLSDPSVGVPTPMLIQWPDRFYHTAADTPDRTDPHSLARAGSLAAMYAYWLAVAGPEEATWLGYEMVARFKARVARSAQDAVAGASGAGGVGSLGQAMAGLDRRLAYLLERQRVALGTLERIAPVECLLADLQREAEQVTERELAWAQRFLELRAAETGLQTLPEPVALPLTEEEQQASDLVPVRRLRGPISLREHLGRLAPQEREAWRQLLKARRGGAHYTLTVLGLYWADGTRSVLDIVDRVELETGVRDVELLLAYFRLLEKLAFVTFQ